MSTRYVDEWELVSAMKSAVAYVTFRGKLRAVRVRGNDWLKLKFTTEDHIGMLREAAGRCGMAKPEKWYPSSYGSLFHEAFPAAKRLRYSERLFMPKSVYGAWEEATLSGRTVSGVTEYDMRSAYAWSALRQIPVARSMWRVGEYVKGKLGIYLAEVVLRGSRRLPPHIRTAMLKQQPVWITNEEIEELDLGVIATRAGLVFAESWAPADRIHAIMDILPRDAWKRVFRSYWGLWASTEPTVNRIVATGKTWTLPNVHFNPVAAHFIVSRVRNRISSVARNAVHIFTDAVITPDKLEEGENLGDWQRKHTFADLTVSASGRFAGKTNDGGEITKHAGTKTA